MNAKKQYNKKYLSVNSGNENEIKSNSTDHAKYSKHNQNKHGQKNISVTDEMQKMKQRREDRIKRMEVDKKNKLELMNSPDYIPKLDLDYENMIEKKKSIIEAKQPKEHTTSDNSKIFVCVRKRPIFQKEIQNGEIDCITALNPKVCVYDCKMKIDGITKYIDCNEFYFDNVFNENEDTELLYNCSIKPTIKLLLQGGVVTCFAYGQTGSGKTYTMKGIQDSAIDSLFENFIDNDTHKYKFYVYLHYRICYFCKKEEGMIILET